MKSILNKLFLFLSISILIVSCTDIECSTNEECLERSVKLLKSGEYGLNKKLLSKNLDTADVRWFYVSGLNSLMLKDEEMSQSSFLTLLEQMRNDCGTAIYKFTKNLLKEKEEYYTKVGEFLIYNISLDLDSICYLYVPIDYYEDFDTLMDSINSHPIEFGKKKDSDTNEHHSAKTIEQTLKELSEKDE